jgi:hypothetical protein
MISPKLQDVADNSQLYKISHIKESQLFAKKKGTEEKGKGLALPINT